MKILKPLLLLVIICSNKSLAAQDCVNYHRRAGCSQASEAGFTYNSQSRSGSLTGGSTFTVKALFYHGFDYSISLCTDKSFQNQVRLELKDAKTGEILYDNATDNNATHTEFSCESVRNTVLYVSLPKKASGPAATVCFGLLIEQRPTPKTGN